MRSKLFKDTQGLDLPFSICAPDKVSVCLRLDRRAYDFAVEQSKRQGLTSGEYMELLLAREAGGLSRPFCADSVRS